ncbi:hypothetical protein AEGHOMDF_1693 [Methylobacterium soli]|nr:hypothetical protein AEGHOMDF_1693 [Methylobacterium soli]
MSTPPSTTETMVKSAPAMKMYQLVRLSLGKARSFAPIISGIRKLPKVAGIDGIRKNHTITTPWMVKALL